MGTYRNQPRLGHTEMKIGISTITDPDCSTRLPGMLLIPFQKLNDKYSINRRNWED